MHVCREAANKPKKGPVTVLKEPDALNLDKGVDFSFVEYHATIENLAGEYEVQAHLTMQDLVSMLEKLVETATKKPADLFAGECRKEIRKAFREKEGLLLSVILIAQGYCPCTDNRDN